MLAACRWLLHFRSPAQALPTSNDFLTVDGQFTLSSSSQNVALSSGTASTTRWLVGGSNLNAFVGRGGPYRLDSDHDGSLDDETPNPLAAGFELTGLDIALALYLEKPSSGSAARSWVTANAQR